MILRFLKLVMVLCITGMVLHAQEAPAHYQHDTDYFGVVDDSGYPALYELASRIADTLDNVYEGEFEVVDGGQYYLSNQFAENPTDHFDRRFEIMKQNKDALLYIGRVVNLNGEFNYYSRVHLAQSDSYSCLGDVAATAMQSYLNAKMNDYGSVSIISGQTEGLKLFLDKINYLTTCCVQSENKNADNVCSACDINGSSSNDPFSEFENLILDHGDESSIGKFNRLANTIFRFSSSEPQFRDIQISQNDSDVTSVPDLIASLASHPTEGSFNLFDDLLAVKAEAQSLGQRDKFHVSVLYIDETNCNDLNSFLSTDARVNSYQITDGTDDSCNGSDPLTCDSGECMLFEEQLIILNFNGEIRVYSKISSPWPVGHLSSQNFAGAGENKSAVVLALIVREVLKRVAMGAMNVFIDAGITIVIEKVFGSPKDCQSGEDLWSDAWSRYRIEEFSNKTYAVWKFITVFAEGAIDNTVFSIISGGIQGSIKYLITGSQNFTEGPTGTGSVNINGPPKSANPFELKIFFTRFAAGAALSSVGPLVGWGNNASKKLLGKVDEAAEGLSEELVEEVKDELLANGGKLMWKIIANHKLIKAWEVCYGNASLRGITDNIDYIFSYLNRYPNLFQALKSNFDALSPSRQQAYINGVRNAAQDAFSIPNARRALPDEISDAVNRIADYRIAVGDNIGGNYGYLEGSLSSMGQVDNRMWRSGAANLNTEPQIFQAIVVEGSSGGAWLRNTDSEYKMLNRLAASLGGSLGNTYPSIAGSLKIVSENPYCASCQGVIQQFNEMFPSINLILVDRVR